MKLYIVMPVINCLDLTKAALASINSRSNVILIDNASTDGTKEHGEYLQGLGIKDGEQCIYLRNDISKGVAASWNQGIQRALEDPECQYIAILNNDIILHPKTLDHLMAFKDKTKYLMVTGDNIKDRMSVDTLLKMELPQPFTDYDCEPITDWRAEGPDFSCYMIGREFTDVMGWFDEKFEGAYCEDQDMHVRIDRARRWGLQYGDPDPSICHAKRLSTAPYFHIASQTIVRNPKLQAEISQRHGKNINYYSLKWGAGHPEAMDGQGNLTPFGKATMNWRQW